MSDHTLQDSIEVEFEFNAAIATVWQAITDPQQMRQWYFEQINQFEPIVGFETRFDVQCDGRNFEHCWKIIEAQPMSVLKYEWSYTGYAGESEVHWMLTEKGQGTQLNLVQIGIETFDQSDPIFSRESGEAGWDYFIRESLANFLR